MESQDFRKEIAPPPPPQPWPSPVKKKRDECTASLRRILLVRRALVMKQLTEQDGLPAQVVPHLFVGSVGSAWNLQALEESGVTHVLSVGSKLPRPYPDRFKYMQVDVADKPSTDLSKYFEACAHFITYAQASGVKALVHCFRGKSRSVTVVCAYLMISGARGAPGRHVNSSSKCGSGSGSSSSRDCTHGGGREDGGRSADVLEPGGLEGGGSGCRAVRCGSSFVSFQEALGVVRRSRPEAEPNLGFVAQLLRLEKSLRVEVAAEKG